MQLKELIPQYGEHNQELKDLEKVCESEKEEIKKQMIEQDLDSESYGGYKVTKIVSKRESFNEERALEILKSNGILNAVKLKEYLDMDALENDLYAGNIPKEVILQLDECRNEKEVITLKCSKEKAK